jgi:hypothetical protein
MQRMSACRLKRIESPPHKSSIQPTSPEPLFMSLRSGSSSGVIPNSVMSPRAPKDFCPFTIASSIAALRVTTSSYRHLTSVSNVLPPFASDHFYNQKLNRSSLACLSPRSHALEHQCSRALARKYYRPRHFLNKTSLTVAD